MKMVHVLAVAALSLACQVSQAVTLRVANAGDVLSMDPHSLPETLQLGFDGNLYEPLVGRDKHMKLTPVLATSWTQTTPTVWRFVLRKGVRFHDGKPFTADDAVFSLERANGKGSAFHNALIKQVRRIDDSTIEIETHAPFLVLPESISIIYMMSRTWCEENRAQNPADMRTGQENGAFFKANGTGPFRLRERQPSLRTVLERNRNYWGPVESNLDEVVFMPIVNDATRVSALLSGAIDLMEPTPLRDVDRIRSTGRFTVLQGPELRTLFLGMDQHRDELLFSDVEGRNPLKDPRVRRAIYQAIDIATIRSQVMRNAATPAGLMVAPGVRGFQPDMNERLPYDPDVARRLLAQAGYPEGFELGMHCPNDRYVNDAALCQSIAAQLARVGVRIRLNIESKSIYLARLLRRDVSFYLYAFTPTTVDAQLALLFVMSTSNGTIQGQGNGGRYSNPRVDELTRRIASEKDDRARNEMIREAFRIHQEDIGHIPLHQQALAWSFDKRVSVVQRPDNFMLFKWVSLKPR